MGNDSGYSLDEALVAKAARHLIFLLLLRLFKIAGYSQVFA